jgi:type II secretory pathway component GspD/PulD (secretin)
MLGSCSTLFGDRADSEGQPLPIASQDDDVAFTGPKTFEEEFPFVRFIDHGDDTLTAILTVPKGSGDSVESQLRRMCDCLPAPLVTVSDPAATEAVVEEDHAGMASIYIEKEGGSVYSADLSAPTRMPWKATGAFKGIEDLVVVTGTEDQLREIFHSLDVWFNSGPQISIEATIFEVLNSETFERGMTQVGTNALFQDEQGQTFLNSIGGSFPTPGNPSVGGPGLGGAFQVGLVDSSFQLNAVLQFLEKEGLANVQSQPSIVTRNGVMASLESTEQIPFLEVKGVSFSGSATFNVGQKSVGVKMYVTPFLVGVDTIHLVIDIEVSRLGQDFVIGTDGNNQQIIAPSLNTRKASTEVYVRNGSTVIIGGLKLIETRVSESRIPLLGDLPLLGFLFSSRSKEELDTTVTFMFTPKIKARPSIDPFGDVFDPFEEAAESE